MKSGWVGSSESTGFALSASDNYRYSSALSVVNIIENLRYIRHISNLVKHNQYIYIYIYITQISIYLRSSQLCVSTKYGDHQTGTQERNISMQLHLGLRSHCIT